PAQVKLLAKLGPQLQQICHLDLQCGWRVSPRILIRQLETSVRDWTGPSAKILYT
ncbi:hypothetical protein STEG23_005410, partial [Scotinomys teguina]